jgi:hypothetical protein
MGRFTPKASSEQINQAEEFFRGQFWDENFWYQSNISSIKTLYTNRQELEAFSQQHDQNMNIIEQLCCTVLLNHYNKQVIQEAKQTIELVFMNPCRICPTTENIDHEFILQWIKDLAANEDKMIKESIYLSIDVDIFKIALLQILQFK